jgi:HSP20 family protein
MIKLSIDGRYLSADCKRRKGMSLIRWTPFGDVDRLFNPLMPSALEKWRRLAPGDGEKAAWAPSADISETDKEYVIRAELPAVKKEDIQVTLDAGMITIKGERKQQKEDKNEKFHRTESFYGTFERRFSLPENVNAEMIRCESKDGILTVHIPKIEAPEHKAKQITVQ